jgi:hypothetical protein
MLVVAVVVVLILVVDRAGLEGLEVVALVRKPEMQLLEPQIPVEVAVARVLVQGTAVQAAQAL